MTAASSVPLSDILEAIDVTQLDNPTNPKIAGIAYDSRKVVPGSLFVCIKGAASDGHAYVDAAIDAGAAAVVVNADVAASPDFSPTLAALRAKHVSVVTVADTRMAMGPLAARFYGDPSSKLLTVGITGTNGKTTSTYLLRSILAHAAYPAGIIGTIAYWVNDQEFPAPFTTPESIDLQALLAQMAHTGPYATHGAAPCKAVVMEVSSHGLELGRSRGIEFDTAVFTNLTRDHLDFHQTFEAYRNAKSKLFTQLRASQQKPYPKVACINGDDPYASFFADVARGALQWDAAASDWVKATPPSDHRLRVITFGLESSNDVYPLSMYLTLFESELKIRTPRAADGTWSGDGPREELLVRTRLRGRSNVYNMLTAVAVAIGNNLAGADIEEGLAQVRSVSGRFESVVATPEQDIGVIVDYAHTPDALERLLKGVREIVSAESRVISVFGCGGDRDKGKRPIMGRLGTELSDFTIVTSDNPRTEDAESIVNMVADGAQEGAGSYEVIVDRRDAIKRAIEIARPGDAVVIAGKGHEDYQIIGKTKIHFDDREEARAFLTVRYAASSM